MNFLKALRGLVRGQTTILPSQRRHCHPLRKEKWSLGSKGHSIMVSRWLGVGCCFLRIHTRGEERHPAASLDCHCKIRPMPWVCSWFQVGAFERLVVRAGTAPIPTRGQCHPAGTPGCSLLRVASCSRQHQSAERAEAEVGEAADRP